MCERFVSYPRQLIASQVSALSHLFMRRANWNYELVVGDHEGCVLLSILMEAGNLTEAHYPGIT